MSTPPLRDTPQFLCTETQVLEHLRKNRRRLSGRVSSLAPLTRFYAQIGTSRSLVLMVAGRVCANLNVPPWLQELPLLQRTGVFTPYMRGEPLGSREDVTDPGLQRVGSLFITTKAAIEEIAGICADIVATIRDASLHHVDLKSVSESINDRGGDYHRLLEAVVHEVTSDASKTAACFGLICIYSLLCCKTDHEHGISQLPPAHTLKEMRENIIAKFVKESIEAKINSERLEDFVLEYCGVRLPSVKEATYQPDVAFCEIEDKLRNCLICLDHALNPTTFRRRHVSVDRIGDISPTILGLAIQGSGDLSMNAWNVAFYRPSQGSNQPRLFIPDGEPYGQRVYHCLLAWRTSTEDKVRTDIIGQIQKQSLGEDRGIALGQTLAIAPIRLSRSPSGSRHVQLAYRAGTYLDESLQFALFGKIVLRDGKPVRRDEVVDRFADLRHMFHLVNLNHKIDPKLNPNPEKESDSFALLLNAIGLVRLDAKDADEVKETEGIASPWLPPTVIQAWNGLKGDIERLEGSRRADMSPVTRKLIDDSVVRGKCKLLRFAAEILKVSERIEQACPIELKEALAKLTPAQTYLLRHISELEGDLLAWPRQLFGQQQDTDVWLLEAALLESDSLRRLACTSTISAPLSSLGASQAWITWRLLDDGYSQRTYMHQIEELGDFCWNNSDRANPVLNIRLKWKAYPCTMVGIGSATDPTHADTLYLLAWGHGYQKTYPTIWECAEAMQAAGAQYALVMDEGQDVFQICVDGVNLEKFSSEEKGGGSLKKWSSVPIAEGKLKEGSKWNLLKRTGLRASLAFWQDHDATA